MKPSPEVVAAAQEAQRRWRVPASVSIGQYALESGWGQHMPPDSFNPFGIKARPGEPFVSVKTREFLGGRYVTVNAPFRKFDNLAGAFEAHAQLLATAPVYALAMEALPNLSLFVSRMAAHYATDPNYAAELLNIITLDKLGEYDQEPAT